MATRHHKPLKTHFQTNLIEAGCDEAGRGCLAGSVYAAAVILPKDYDNPLLDDSKKLTEKQRYALRQEIEHNALAWAVGVVTPREIDQINILHASFLAMHRALDRLKVRPEYLIIDGNHFDPYIPNDSPDAQPLPHTCIVKGDAKYQSIAAAAILAKTYRDDYMTEMDALHPEYGWKTNKGYPTPPHRAAIKQYGATAIHRMSYRLLPENAPTLCFDEIDTTPDASPGNNQ